MAAIFAGNIYCDDCARDIRHFICDVLWEDREVSVCPDGVKVNTFAWRGDFLDHMYRMYCDNYETYGSEDYPKYCSDIFESDVPEHCAAGDGCKNYETLNDGTKIGHFFGNPITEDGVEYIKNVARVGCVASELWAPYYELMGYDV